MKIEDNTKDLCVFGEGSLLTEMYYKNNALPSSELAIACKHTINNSTKLTKIALFIIWSTRSYEELGYLNMKKFIIKETCLTYDSAIKQLEAAKIAAEHFGIDKIGYFSDSSMRTLAQIRNFDIRERVIVKIADTNNTTRDNIDPKILTSKLITDTANEVMNRNLYSSTFVKNNFSRDLYDENFISFNSSFLDEKVIPHDEQSKTTQENKSTKSLTRSINYNDPNLNT